MYTMKRRHFIRTAQLGAIALLAQSIAGAKGRDHKGRKQADASPTLASPARAPQGAINIMDFGASADGSSNDAGAINAAIQQLASKPEGGIIWFPKGRYWINPQELSGNQKQLFSQFSNIEFAGAGSDQTEWMISPSFSDENHRLFYHERQHSCKSWCFRDILFNCQGDRIDESKECFRDKLIKVFVSDFKVQDCVFKNEPGRGLFTVLGDHQYYKNCSFYGTGCRATDSSIIHPGNIASNANHIEIINCRAISGDPEASAYNRTTFYDAQASNVLIKGCEIKGGKKGFILALGAKKNQNITMVDCTVEVHHHCLHIYPSRNTVRHEELSGIVINNCSLESAVPLQLNGAPEAAVCDVTVQGTQIETTRGLRREWLRGSYVRNLVIKDSTICRRLGNCTTIKRQHISAPKGNINVRDLV